MRKRINTAIPETIGDDVAWLTLTESVTVEVTSEHPAYPIERALDCQTEGGWRAGAPGEQRIVLGFDAPVTLRRIQLQFTEPTVERTQEFTLTWSGSDGTGGLIVRQQWNFSPEGSTVEREDYAVELKAVAKLELHIRPGAGSSYVATLDCWRMA